MIFVLLWSYLTPSIWISIWIMQAAVTLFLLVEYLIFFLSSTFLVWLPWFNVLTLMGYLIFWPPQIVVKKINIPRLILNHLLLKLHLIAEVTLNLNISVCKIGTQQVAAHEFSTGCCTAFLLILGYCYLLVDSELIN